MRTLPKRDLDRITFVLQRCERWEAAAAQLGITPGQAAEAGGLAEEAAAARSAALAARAAAVSATRALQTAMDRLTRSASTIIQTARLTAQSGGGPEVYTLADIPAPKTPSPAGPPPRPRILRHECNPDGSVTLLWRGTLSRSAFYTVLRHIPGLDSARGPAQIGVVGATRFTDRTVPAGAGRVFYTVRGRRGTLDGPDSPIYTVNLGVQEPIRTAA